MTCENRHRKMQERETCETQTLYISFLNPERGKTCVTSKSFKIVVFISNYNMPKADWDMWRTVSSGYDQ